MSAAVAHLQSFAATAAPLRRVANKSRASRRAAPNRHLHHHHHHHAVVVRASADDVERSGTSYYKVIDGVKYDRKVLDDCVAYEKNNGEIDLEEAKRIMGDLLDGPARKVGGANDTKTTVTNVELDTAQYAFDNFTWSAEAKDWFFKKLTEKNW